MSIRKLTNTLLLMLAAFFIAGCQKAFHYDTSSFVAKQVINSNFTYNKRLVVNISKSKAIEDFSPIEFLSNCEVDLYENNVFIERLQYVLVDTTALLGSYASTQRLKQDKTYLIVSRHPEFGTATAREYLASTPLFSSSLANHADSTTVRTTAQITLAFRDSMYFENLYFASVFYRVIGREVNGSDTTYTTNWVFNLPMQSSLYANPFRTNRIYFKDNLFDGYFHTVTFTFPSIYVKNAFRQDLFIEMSGIGQNYYDMYSQQFNIDENEFNQGANEPLNAISNVRNGYGHFSSYNSNYIIINIK